MSAFDVDVTVDAGADMVDFDLLATLDGVGDRTRGVSIAASPCLCCLVVVVVEISLSADATNRGRSALRK